MADRMKPSNVSSLRFQVDAIARAAVNSKLKTLDFKQFALAGTTLVVTLLAPGVAFAQGMTDPTRPPPTETTEAESGAPEVAGPVLQSVMITPTFKAAIINGEMVKLGGKFGNAQLVKVSESEVVLKSGDEAQVLKMYPGVEKREIARAAPKAASRRTQATQRKPADTGVGVAR